jgi:sporulation protein YlmC with PRC-barrel domain
MDGFKDSSAPSVSDGPRTHAGAPDTEKKDADATNRLKGAMDMREHAPHVLSASTLIGDQVTNNAGEDLGEVKDFVLDLRTGRTAYAVLDFGGFLGVGNKLFAVPFEAMTLNPAEKRFILDIDKQRLKDAPGFDKDDWPEDPDFSFVNEVHRYYGLEPYVDLVTR